MSQDGGSEVRTLLADGLGSVRLELAGGAVEAVTTYSPYGEVLEQNGTRGTVYGFTGEQQDGATGLLYLRARYYNSSLKVFQSRDPWEGSGWRPETLNRYVYVGGDPVRFSDPFGLCRTDDPYDPYADTECLEIAAYLARRDPTNGFNTYAQFSTFTLAKRRDELILQNARTTGLVAIIEFFRVDGHGPASLRLERLLEKTDSLSFMGINFRTGLNFGIRIPGGASLCEDFEDKQFYASDGGFSEWQQVSRGADVQMSHFLSAVALAYYGLDNSPFSGAALARISTGVGPFSEADSSTSFSEFWNMSNDELAIRLIVGHEVVPDRRGPIGSWLANIEQLLASTDQQVRNFIQAVAYDVAGNQLQRDAHLNSIFNVTIQV